MFALYACKYLAAVTTEIALNENEWIKLNYDHTGYYRVNYSPELWQRLINQLNTDHKVQINGVSEKWRDQIAWYHQRNETVYTVDNSFIQNCFARLTLPNN